jgi:hypothetical protein
MKTISLLVIIAVLLTAPTLADPGDTLWTRTYGGVGLGEYCNQVQQTSDGGFIFAGQNGFEGGIFPWLVKTDADGNMVWSEVYYEATTNTYFSSVMQTSDGGYIAGGISRANWGTSRIDYYLVRTDSSGGTIWSNTYSTEGYGFDYGESVRETFDDGFIFGGNTAPGPRPYEFFLVRTNASGDTVWTRTYGDGGAGDERAHSVIQTADGSFVMAGYTNSYGAGSWDFYLVKVDSFGDTVWTRTYGGTSGEEAFCVQETSDGGFVIAGYTSSFGSGLQDFYVVRTDSIGNTLWENTYGGPQDDYAKSVKQTPDNGFIIVGSTASFGAGFTDCYIVRTNASGDTLWTRAYGGYDDERAYSVDLTSDGGYIVGGHTSSFGSGDYDVWLLRLAGEVQEPVVSIDMIPDNPPITVPPGGSFTYTGVLINNTDLRQLVDVGIYLDVPGIGRYGPIDGILDIPLDAYDTLIAESMRQRVPRFAPLGEYNYVAICGDYPTMRYDSVMFEFAVAGMESGPGDDWNTDSWIDRGIILPKEIILGENYPNPFNSQTSIEFILPEAARVELKVYNILGQELETLADGFRSPGRHEVIWDATGFASGIYFYKLTARQGPGHSTAGDKAFTRRMVLLK